MFKGLRRFFQRLGRKSQTFRAVTNYVWGGPSWSARDVAAFAREGYAGNPYVYAAINAVVQGLSEGPPVLYRVRGGSKIERRVKEAYGLEAGARGISKAPHSLRQAAENQIGIMARKHIKQGVHPTYARRMAIKRLVAADELEEIESHPVLDLLKHPNGWMQRSYTDLTQAFGLSLLLAGEVFTEPKGNRDAKGEPSEIYILPAHEFEAERARIDNPIPGWLYRGRSVRFMYSPDPQETEIFFDKLYDPINPIRGLSPMSAALRSVDLNNEARAFNLAYMRNNGVPAALVTGQFNEEQAAFIRRQMEEQAASSSAGRVLTLSGEGLQYKQLSMDAAKLKWGDVLTMTAKEVAIVFGVPPEILGDSTNKTYSNYAEARLALYQDCILPLCDRMFDAWNSSWVRRFGEDIMLDYDTDQILAVQADIEAVYGRLEGANFLTINEKREAVGYEDVPGGDVLWVPLTQVPLEVAVDQDEDDPVEDDATKRLVKRLALTNGHAN